MLSVREWMEKCEAKDKLCYWFNDTVVIVNAKDVHPSYKHDELRFVCSMNSFNPCDIFKNEVDCAKHEIELIKIGFNIED